MSSEVIVFLPGTTGSTLVSFAQPQQALIPVWRAQVAAAALMGQTSKALALLEGQLYPGIVPLTIPLTGGPSVYQILFNGLAEFRYTCASSPHVGNPPAPAPANWGLPPTISGNALIGFPYDWRQDNATTAKWLQSLLGAIYTAANQNCTITLLAHSMGGLVARAYLEALGGSDPWFGSIKQLITIATPHLGAPAALGAITDDFADLSDPPINFPNFLDVVVWQFVNSSFDSTFELLPPPGNAFVNDNGTQRSIFPYSGLSQGLQRYLTSEDFSETNAQNAAAFLGTLSYKGAIPYYLLYGTGIETTPVGYTFNGTSLTVSNGDGDAIVPTSSASFAGTKVAATVAIPGVDHLQLPGDSTVIAQIRQWMGLPSAVARTAA